MFNYIILESSDLSTVVTREIVEAITTVGRDTEYFRETYTPLIEQRLRDAGWRWLIGSDTWFRDEDQFTSLMSEKWGHSTKPELIGDEPLEPDSLGGQIERLEELVEAAEQSKDALTEFETDGLGEINRAIQAGETRLEKKRKIQRKRR